MKYKIFSRPWYYPNGDPHPNASKRFIGWCATEQEARTKCNEWNDSHDKGKTGVMAEYERVG